MLFGMIRMGFGRGQFRRTKCVVAKAIYCLILTADSCSTLAQSRFNRGANSLCCSGGCSCTGTAPRWGLACFFLIRGQANSLCSLLLVSYARDSRFLRTYRSGL